MIRRLTLWLLLCAAVTTQAATFQATAMLGVKGGPGIPVFSVGCGSYGSTQTVALTSPTFGASIYYTIDGTTPTTASTPYTSVISVATTTTLNAFSVAPLVGKSAIANCPYTIIGSSAIKWHPGQYMSYPLAFSQAPINPSNQSGLWSSYGPDMRGSINPATGKPGFVGILNDYSWFYLDMCAPSGSGGCNVGPTDGTAGGGTLPSGYSSSQYNTILIDNDLATLAAASAADGVHYRLGILVMSEYWQKPSSFPTVPQGNPYTTTTNSNSIAPDYIITGVGGYGTDLVFTSNAATIALWRPATMTAYINLMNYLGAKYDGNPSVEFITPIPETGLTWVTAGCPTSGCEPSDYSASAFQTEYLALASAMSTSWPHTNKMFDDNWGIQGEALSTMAARDATVAGNSGWGFGGPDVIYLNPNGATTPWCTANSTTSCETSGEGIVRGEGSSYGTNVFKGAVPLGYQVQANAYTWTNQTSAGTESYGFNQLGITHFIWIDTQTNGNATQTLTGIRSALGAVNYRINSACPTNYPACNTL